MLCPICRQLLAPAAPGWAAHQTDLPAGWDCPYAHAASTPRHSYDAARIHWLTHDQALLQRHRLDAGEHDAAP